jgi:undecaprenyl-diphosphatase
MLVVSTIPALIAGLLFNDLIETSFRGVGLVALLLVIGAGVLWLADRLGRQAFGIDGLGFGGAFGIGLAQALALMPGISRSGISIAAGLFAGLDRPAAARFSFLMATPVIAGAGLYEARRLVTGDVGFDVPLGPLLAGVLAALLSGLLAIHVLLRYLRTHGLGVFVAYRLILAALLVVVFLGR